MQGWKEKGMKTEYRLWYYRRDFQINCQRLMLFESDIVRFKVNFRKKSIME